MGSGEQSKNQGADMTVLVIGATGKTGRPLVEALVARGVKVRAASRKPGAASEGVEPARFDWSDRQSWADALRGVEGLYIVGPYAEADADVLVGELLAVADDVRRVVLLSVIGADRLPSAVPMARWERDVRASGKAWTILRPNWFQQNFGEGGFTAPLRDRGLLELAAADAAVSFVDTRDVAEVAATALTEDGHDGQVYEITGPRALTHADVVALLGSAAGRELRYVVLDPELMVDRMRTAGATERTVLWQQGLFAMMRAGADAPVSDVVRRVTGREPRSLTDYASEHAADWRSATS
jgi:uncharacterized protein YbjT (DUF2867 family)